ncbi:MAG: hypothetical protein ACRDL7_13910, partial [Gaiellaceae bacterium]
VYLLNHLASPILNHRTPIEVALGITPDISNLLQFRWYEPVLYYDPSASFPTSREQSGRFVGIAANCGDALTFKIYSDKTGQVLHRSVVRSAIDKDNANLCVENVDATKEILTCYSDEVSTEKLTLPTVDPNNLLGFKFVHMFAGDPFRAEVVNKLPDDKFLVALGAGVREEIMTYNEIIQIVSRQLKEDLNYGEREQTYKKICDHWKAGNTFEVLILWDDGDETWELINNIYKTDPMTLAKYAKDNNLLDVNGWKRFRRMVDNEKRYIRMLEQARVAQVRNARTIVMKYGVQVPRTPKEAEELDVKNGNSLWKEAIKREMDQIFEYETFIDHGKGASTPDGHKKIKTHLVFDVKY